jgi:hypothetical protein
MKEATYLFVRPPSIYCIFNGRTEDEAFMAKFILETNSLTCKGIY